MVISVQLDCTPSILNAVLTPVLGDLPEVALLNPSTTPPDVLVVSACDGTKNRLNWLEATRRGATIVSLDAQNNTIRIRRGGQSAIRDRTLVGTLANFQHVIRELSKVDSPELNLARQSAGIYAQLTPPWVLLELLGDTKPARDARVHVQA
jgi:hypothetical protein